MPKERLNKTRSSCSAETVNIESSTHTHTYTHKQNARPGVRNSLPRDATDRENRRKLAGDKKNTKIHLSRLRIFLRHQFVIINSWLDCCNIGGHFDNMCDTGCSLLLSHTYTHKLLTVKEKLIRKRDKIPFERWEELQNRCLPAVWIPRAGCRISTSWPTRSEPFSLCCV